MTNQDCYRTSGYYGDTTRNRELNRVGEPYVVPPASDEFHALVTEHSILHSAWMVANKAGDDILKRELERESKELYTELVEAYVR